MPTKIAIMSFADFQNMGDMLFPFLAREELIRRIPDAEFRFFTPSETIIEKESFFRYSPEALQRFNPHAVILWGGETIHKGDSVIWMLNGTYSQVAQNCYNQKPSSIVFDWLSFGNWYKAWFSVGVIDLGTEHLLPSPEDLQSLDYIGVRGILSKQMLDSISGENREKTKIVPDVGWLFKRLAPNRKVTLERLSCSLKFDLYEDGYSIFNCNCTSLPEPKILESALYRLAEAGERIFLLPVIATYNDTDMLRSFLVHPNIKLLPQDLSLREKLSALQGAKYYVGSSLHCAIAAMSTGKNAGIIHCANLTKLQDLFSHSMRLEYLENDWNHFSDMCERLKRPVSPSLETYGRFLEKRADEAIDELCEKILAN